MLFHSSSEHVAILQQALLLEAPSQHSAKHIVSVQLDMQCKWEMINILSV